jgi:uncharacterized protein (DUF58 family)
MKLSHKIAAALTVAALGFTPGAWAQGCVLCYTSLSNGGPAAMYAFQVAMFALLIPALLLFLGVALLIFRRARTATVAPATTRKRVNAVRPIAHSINPAEGKA